ncbi:MULTISPECIES: FAD-dependent oxidoreductase [Streptomyces]|uniref:D-amino-acid oxidase n=2 Tax=Streptomyces TaxID=1883 RepID=A0ABU2QVM9_9ACTN|nr:MULTISPECIES: FAD-dependent oxidoreductase [unclassified Streptomyces]MDT0408503.1 FAD-dependent oxidoreductase [Streptomyces sp. DSM 41979]MDT0422289.1 FAD-dependent oxidoreductase [Streptomyces sp. DSM 41859]MYQ56657.1 FAD-dependent oxidoreductase [Streptomyces sp. SID4926]
MTSPSVGISAPVRVLGSGVIGLSTALELRAAGHEVEVWAERPAARATSAVAGGLWWPYHIEPEERVGAWALETLAVYEEWAAEPERTGVRLVEGVHAETSFDTLGPWAGSVRGLRTATAAESPYSPGLFGRLPVVDMPHHLAWLEQRLRAAGCRLVPRTAPSLAEAAEGARAVVNCTGLGARSLVPDEAVHPVRGQLVLVENPGVTTWFTSTAGGGDRSVYYIPQPYGLLLGGTAEEHDFRESPDPATAEAIVRDCAALRPEITGARVLAHRVGLRPARTGGVRLTAEHLADGTPVVHNYGHGGAGVTVAWGCAREAARLVTEVPGA